MKTFKKIVRTFFLVLLLLIVGIAVGYVAARQGWDKMLIESINPDWVWIVEGKKTDDTVTNTANRDDRTVSQNLVDQNVVSNQVINQTANQVTNNNDVTNVANVRPSGIKEVCYYCNILDVAETSSGATSVEAKGMDINGVNGKGNFSFLITDKIPVYYNNVNINVNESNLQFVSNGLAAKLKPGMRIALYHEGEVLETSPAQLTKVNWVEILSEYPRPNEVSDYNRINQVTIMNRKTNQMAYLEENDRIEFLDFLNNECAFIDNSYAIDSPIVNNELNTDYVVTITYDDGHSLYYRIVKYTDVFDPWYAVFKDEDTVPKATEFRNTRQVDVLTNILTRYGI